MSDLIIKKNGTDYKLPMLAEHYPADRVYLHGDIEKNVEDALKSGTITLPYTSQYYCQKDITVPSGAKVVANFVYGTGAYNKTSGVMVSNLTDTTAKIIAFSSGGTFTSGDSVDVNYICF